MMSFYMKFITAVSCYGANVGGVLLLKDAICKCVFGVIVVDRHSDLRDDRAVVKTGAHEVDGAACPLRSPAAGHEVHGSSGEAPDGY